MDFDFLETGCGVASMKVPDLRRLYSAFKFLRIGNREQAQAILSGLERTYPSNPNIMLWRIFVTQDYNEAQQLLQKLHEVAPNHPGIGVAEKWMEVHELRNNYQQARKLGTLRPEEVALLEDIARLTGLAGFLGVEEKEEFPFFWASLGFTALMFILLSVFSDYWMLFLGLTALGIIFTVLAFFYERAKQAVQAGRVAWGLFRVTRGRFSNKNKNRPLDENVIIDSKLPRS